MATIHHRILVDAPASSVYEAISNPERIGSWWDQQTVTHTDRGTVLEHNPGPEHGIVKLLVVELVPNERIEWECISTHPTTSPASAWTGTRFTFELSSHDDGTTVDFTQSGYDEQSPFFASNKAAWGEVLQNLKHVLEAAPTR
jgi:uncharacterized protein YndB with AHSA1/START domain